MSRGLLGLPSAGATGIPHTKVLPTAVRDLAIRSRRIARLAQTDHLDLCKSTVPASITSPSWPTPEGVLEALDKAKKQGKVRFVGFTWYKHPAIYFQIFIRLSIYSVRSAKPI